MPDSLAEAQLLSWISPAEHLNLAANFSLEKHQSTWPCTSWPHSMCLPWFYGACLHWSCIKMGPFVSLKQAPLSIEVLDRPPPPVVAPIFPSLPPCKSHPSLCKTQLLPVATQPYRLPSSVSILPQMGLSQLVFLMCFRHLITCLCVYTWLYAFVYRHIPTWSNNSFHTQVRFPICWWKGLRIYFFAFIA